LQRIPDPQRAQYVEGNEEYNIWYGKFENDRFNPKDREPAPWKCDPVIDSGWTEVDLPGAEVSYFCLFFAKGCCSAGHRCRYYHRVPTRKDCDARDVAHDIFGRERFSNHRDDMGGVGSFNSDCQTLFVGDIRFDRSTGSSADALIKAEHEIRDGFEPWGEVESVRLIPQKAIAFVRYSYRAAAEFAKEAMSNQSVGKSRCITVKWAAEDRNPKALKQRRMERQAAVEAAVEKRLDGLSASELETLSLMHQPPGFEGCVAPYPRTLSGSVGGLNSTGGVTSMDDMTPDGLPNSTAASSCIKVQTADKPTSAAFSSNDVDVEKNVARMNAVLCRIDAMEHS